MKKNHLSILFIMLFLLSLNQSCYFGDENGSSYVFIQPETLLKEDAKKIGLKIGYSSVSSNNSFSLKICTDKKFTNDSSAVYMFSLNDNNGNFAFAISVNPMIETHDNVYYTFQVSKDLISNLEILIVTGKDVIEQKRYILDVAKYLVDLKLKDGSVSAYKCSEL